MVNQHMRALKSMGYDPPSHFITSLIELKLDQGTMFEWQRHSQESSSVPPFDKLLQFINLRTQASESTPTEVTKKRAFDRRRVTSLTADVDESCVVCKTVVDTHCIVARSSRHCHMTTWLQSSSPMGSA